MKWLRKVKGVKQIDMAVDLYVSGHTICCYETGTTEPGLDMLIDIAKYLGTDPNTLLGWKGKKIMQYPKAIMSITELSELGYPVEFLRQLARADGAPCFRQSESRNGKVFFYTDQLEKFIDEVEDRRVQNRRRR